MFFKVLVVFCKILSWCPKWVVDCIVWGLSRFLFIGWIAQKEFKQLEKNISDYYQLPVDRGFGAAFKKQVVCHQIETAIETIQEIFSPGTVEVEGLAGLGQAMSALDKAGKGQILITAHLGSWELLGRSAALTQSKTFHVLAKPPRNQTLWMVLQEIRNLMGTPVLWTHQKSLLKNMLKAMQEGSWLGFVMDQKPEGRKGPLVDFLGKKTEFVSGPAVIAAKCNSPIISAYCVRVSSRKYKIIHKTLLEANHGIKSIDVISQMCADSISSMIETYPEQWSWNYKRWSAKL